MGDSSTHPAGTIYHASLPHMDALPYYDDELSKPGMQAKVEREIANEMKKSSLDDVEQDRLPRPLMLFEGNEELQKYLQKIEQDGTHAQSALDKSRYQLAAPEAGVQASTQEWEAALRNAEAQLMHSEGRMTNLELLKKFGANHWRLHNFQQEAFVRLFEKASNETQSDTTQLHRNRKQQQTSAGAELTRLNKRWAELLNRSLSVELANLVAANEIDELEERRAALQKELDAA